MSFIGVKYRRLEKVINILSSNVSEAITPVGSEEAGVLEFVIGVKQEDAAAVDNLSSILRTTPLDGTVYIGYPALATPDEAVFVEAMLTCRQCGVVVFDLLHSWSADDGNYWDNVRDRQDSLYAAMESKLKAHRSLRTGRGLAVPLAVVSYSPRLGPNVPDDPDLLVADSHTLPGLLASLPQMPDHLMAALNAAIQRVTTIKPPKKRLKVTQENSRGAILKQIEQNIANLDRWQKKAAIEVPDGAQRIRGLAGSGKTIVLALKAAYLHSRHPDWNIAVTFYTRTLYQQFKDLIRRFTFEHVNDEPDWSRLRILHAWGSRSEPGIYSEMCVAHGAPVLDLTYGKEKFGTGYAFAGVCEDLLSRLDKNPDPIFDAILIDEAQDFHTSFFHLAYASVGYPKRILWAYDELQSLSEFTMAPPGELFGYDEAGNPLIELHNEEGQPQQDVILPVCYRNPPWALATAHALGFGVYRSEGMIQFFDEPSLWTDIGYEIRSGELSPGKQVALERSRQSAPEYFAKYLTPEDAVQCFIFNSAEEQAEWIAAEIEKNITIDELEPDDILIIGLNPPRIQSQAAPVMRALQERGISSHIAGVTSSRDAIFVDGSISVASIYRAKGNEAPMVYVIHGEYAAEGYELIRRRNSLFTGITRSRAWVRICGVGQGMTQIADEAQAVVDNRYRLVFKTPTPSELQKMRKIHRDRTPEERERAKQMERNLRKAFEFADEFTSLEDMPADLRDMLRRLVRQDEGESES